jgi:TPR repeat protein
MRDFARARKWFEASGAAGFPLAFRNLGMIYEQGGFGLARNLGEAERWYAKGMEAGEKDAAERLKRLRDRLAQAKPAPASPKPAPSQGVDDKPPPGGPAKPQGKAPSDTFQANAVTPEFVLAQMEAAAKRNQGTGQSFTYGFWFNFRSAASAPTFAAALGNNVVALITVLARNPEQLPVTRVYIRAGDRDLPLTKLLSWQSQADAKLASSQVYGRNREDGFYLIPITMMLREGQARFDMNGKPGIPLLQLPSKALQGRSDPGAPQATDAQGLRSFITRIFPGFPAP